MIVEENIITQKLNIKNKIAKTIAELFDIHIGDVQLEYPADVNNGDISSNIAMVLVKEVGKNPREIAEMVKDNLEKLGLEGVKTIEVAGPGFINFYLSEEYLVSQINLINSQKEHFGEGSSMKDKKIMVEFAHPNTHKEMHIGHMRTLIEGESLARLFQSTGAEVYKANYQGDIGPHVAKAIWGTKMILEERGLSLEQADNTLTNNEKAHLLGEGYVRGNKDYEKNEAEIKDLNKDLYQQKKDVMPIYELTRQWSLDYYDELYKRFGTMFDGFFFESEVYEQGIKMVKEHIGEIFTEDQGAIIFEGEKHGLHTRVFITQEGYPTYEAKDMALAPMQFEAFPFDINIHVVGDEQSGYFAVVFKALSLIDSKFEGRQYHLPMGMVNLKGLKMSSRTGVLITVDGLLEEVKDALREIVQESDLDYKEKEDMLEKVTLAAVKYSVLKNDPEKYVLFDLKESINLNGNSGPYLQYTYARCKSLLTKANKSELPLSPGQLQGDNIDLLQEELEVMRLIYRYPEVIEDAAREYSPNLVCAFIYDLAQKYNTFYNAVPILKAETLDQKEFRLQLTSAVSHVIKSGLVTLGIQVSERM